MLYLYKLYLLLYIIVIVRVISIACNYFLINLTYISCEVNKIQRFLYN